MLDTSFTALHPYLVSCELNTLWIADENAAHILKSLENHQQKLHIVSNRYDIYQIAQDKGFSVEFNDFQFTELPWVPQRIIYRISKEKALNYHILNQACHLLGNHGEFLISGKKQEGIKSYADTLCKMLNARGKLKKQGTNYFGCFTNLNSQTAIDNTYHQIQKITTDSEGIPYFFSKPGVFGWNKIDAGTQLLLDSLPDILASHTRPIESILDLGCGYGWISLNLPNYLPQETSYQIIATDNNAAALLCMKKNAKDYDIKIEVEATDCAASLSQSFDLIVCNPPFHQGFVHDKSLTEKFLIQTNRHLKKTGLAIFVVNEFVKLSVESFDKLAQYQEWTHNKGFKVVSMSSKA